jgi:site-specific DNA-adenine methylase
MKDYSPPFPWFGEKRKVAPIVWHVLGDADNYVEPFFGSGAVLFMRPKEHEGYVETVNDYDGYVANFWRAVQAAPEEVAYVVIQSGRMKDVIL